MENKAKIYDEDFEGYLENALKSYGYLFPTTDEQMCCFEENMEELEKVVAELEKGDLNLDDSVSRFEQGIKISKECSKILEEAEKKITILVKKDDEMKEENFQTKD